MDLGCQEINEQSLHILTNIITLMSTLFRVGCRAIYAYVDHNTDNLSIINYEIIFLLQWNYLWLAILFSSLLKQQILFFFLFWCKVLLHSSGLSQSHITNIISASTVLGLKTCSTIPSFIFILLNLYFFCDLFPWIEWKRREIMWDIKKLGSHLSCFRTLLQC